MGLGLAVGGLLTIPLVGLLRGLLQGLSTVEPMTLVVIAVVLFGVTMLATFVPAARAATVDPLLMLRGD